MKKRILQLFILFLLLISTLIGMNISWDIPVNTLKEQYANEQSKFIAINDLDVHYRDEGTGFPIILLHGTGASLHTWDAWTAELKKEYRVIRMDLPAFGLTGPNADHDYRIKTYTEFLDQFISTLSIDSFHLAGNSLGGQIAWNYAADYPEKVAKLILVDPSGFPSEHGTAMVFRLARTPILNNIMRFVTPKSFIKKNLKEVYYNDEKITPELIDRYYHLTLRTGNRDAFIARAKLHPKPDNTPKLNEITAPTLIIWGEEDTWIPVVDGKRFEAAIPNAQLVVLEQTGHVPMEESPQRSLKSVLQFLK